jgi:HAD superfamily hydrolase (TIGR01549 family)
MAVLRAVLFDYGLTLVTFEYPRAELKRAMEEVRLWLPPPAPDAETLMREVVLPLEEALDDMGEDEVDYLAIYELQWRRAGFPLRRALLERILDREQRVWDDAARLAPDAISTLRALRERGIRTGLVSNAPFPPALLHRQLAHVGLAPLLDVALFSSEVGKRKPSATIFELALDGLGVAAAEALFVGDRPEVDYEGPRRVGMRAVVCTAFARGPIPAGVPTISRLSDVVDLLQ